MCSRLPRFLLLSLLVSLTFSSAFAQPDNWKGGTGNWSNGTNWDAGVPGPSNDVTIDSGHVDMVTFDIDSAINSLTVGGATGSTYLFSATPQNLTMTQDLNLGVRGTLGWFDRSTISIGGAVSNAGQINLGVYYLQSKVKVTIAGVLTNSQSLSGVTIERDSSLTVGGVVNYGYTTVNNGSTLTVNGDLQNLQVPSQYVGYIETQCDRCASVAGNKIIVTGSLVNDGIFYLNVPGDVARASRLENYTLMHLTQGTALQIGSVQAAGPGYSQGPDGVFAEHVLPNGASALIRVAGPIHLAGTLQVLLQDGYNPPPGQMIPIIDLDADFPITGTFDKIENQYFNNGTEMWEVMNDYPTGVFLVAVAVQDSDSNAQPK